MDEVAKIKKLCGRSSEDQKIKWINKRRSRNYVNQQAKVKKLSGQKAKVKKLGGQVGKVGKEWKMVTHMVGDGGGGKVGEGE